MSSMTWRCREVMPFGSISACMGRRYEQDANVTIRRKAYSRGRRWLRPANKGGMVAARVRRAGLVLRERADARQQLEFVLQMRAHHLRAVRRDRERDARVDEGAERVANLGLVGQGLREQIRCRAYLECHARVTQERKK